MCEYHLKMIFSQEEYSPEDPANPCVNYPTEEYESYADCDDHFVRKSLPPGLRPFWAVDNISEATNNFHSNDLFEVDVEIEGKVRLYRTFRRTDLIASFYRGLTYW